MTVTHQFGGNPTNSPILAPDETETKRPPSSSATGSAATPKHRLYPIATERKWDRHKATDTRRNSMARSPARSGPPSASRTHRRVAGPKQPIAPDTNGVKVWVIPHPTSASAYLVVLAASRAKAVTSRSGEAAALAKALRESGDVNDASAHTTTLDVTCVARRSRRKAPPEVARAISATTSVHDGAARSASIAECARWWWRRACREDSSGHANRKWRPSASASRPHRHRRSSGTDGGGSPSHRRTCSGSRHHHFGSSSRRSDLLVSSVRRRDYPENRPTAQPSPHGRRKSRQSPGGNLSPKHSWFYQTATVTASPLSINPSPTRTPAAKVATPNAPNR